MAPLSGKHQSLTPRDTVALPAKLLQTIPTCAQECVSNAVNASFVPSKCTNSNDAGCLCSHYSTSGYTLGELALACLYSNCSESTRQDSSHDVFNLCSANTRAVSATHAVLTLTTMGSASSTSAPTSTSASDTTTTHLVPSSSGSSYSTQPANTTSVFSPTAAPTSSGPPASQSSQSTQDPKGLTTGQAVGISVASIAIAALLFGLCFFCCCCVRRRKKEKKTGSPTKKWIKSRNRLDFQDDASPTGSKFFSPTQTRDTTDSPQGPTRPPRSFQESPDKSPNLSVGSSAESPEMSTGGPLRPPVRPQLQWWRQTSSPEVNHAPTGLKSQRASISSGPQDTHQAHRSESNSSQQRKSSKMSAPIINVTLNLKKASRQLRPDSSATGWTMFEEDGCKSPLYKKVLPKPPCLPKPVLLPPISPPPGPSFADQYTVSPEDMTKTGLTLQIPRKPLKYNELPVPTAVSANTGISKIDHLSMPPSSAASYLPAYYTSIDSRTPVAPKWSPPGNVPRFSQPQFVPKPLTSRGVRASWASATTFESVDPDETTPENEEDKQLSPVAYPKVPRPSNQAIPRSPPSTVSPSPRTANSSGKKQPTLFSKRRGEDISLDLGKGLMISNMNGEHSNTREVSESPLKGYGRGATAQDQAPQMELKSPLWEPKLTPSRRGEDLYLSVEMKGR